VSLVALIIRNDNACITRNCSGVKSLPQPVAQLCKAKRHYRSSSNALAWRWQVQPRVLQLVLAACWSCFSSLASPSHAAPHPSTSKMYKYMADSQSMLGCAHQILRCKRFRARANSFAAVSQMSPHAFSFVSDARCVGPIHKHYKRPMAVCDGHLHDDVFATDVQMGPAHCNALRTIQQQHHSNRDRPTLECHAANVG
jgi:hypothetical protein